MLKHSIVGSPETVRRDLESFVALTKADELMVVSSLHDHPRPHALLRDCCRDLSRDANPADHRLGLEGDILWAQVVSHVDTY